MKKRIGTVYVSSETYSNVLAHHGILGMKWGIRRYQNKDGTLTAAGRKRYGIGSSPIEPGSKREELYNNRKAIVEAALASKKYNFRFDERLGSLYTTQKIGSDKVRISLSYNTSNSYYHTTSGIDELVAQITRNLKANDKIIRDTIVEALGDRMRYEDDGPVDPSKFSIEDVYWEGPGFAIVNYDDGGEYGYHQISIETTDSMVPSYMVSLNG